MNFKRRNLINPSTPAFIREARQTPGYRLFDFLHGYVYTRWPYLYISIGKGEHRFTPTLVKLSGLFARIFLLLLNPNTSESKSNARTFADSYHGKVVPLEAAKQLVAVQEDIRLENLEKIIPYT